METGQTIKNDIEEPSGIFFNDKKLLKKHLIIGVVAFSVLCVYFTASWMIDLRFASAHKQQFSKDLQGEALNTSEIISNRVKNLTGSLTLFRNVYLKEFAEDKRGLGSVIDLFEMEIDSFPELVSLSYMDASSELVYARGVEGDEGETAVNASIDWAREYWSRIGPDDDKPFFTPVKKVDRYSIVGILYPVALTGKIAGGLMAVADAETIAMKSFELISIPQVASAFLLDTSGTTIAAYSRENDAASALAGVFDKNFMKKVMTLQCGYMDIDNTAFKKSGKKVLSGRYIAAWQQMRLGSKDTVVVIASPIEESVRVFKKARLIHMLLELFFAVAISLSAGWAIWVHRRKDLLSGEQENKG